MKDIYSLLESKSFISHMTNRPQRKFIGEALFPSEDTDSLSFEYLKEANSNPIMAKAIPWGAEAPQVGRDGLQTATGKIKPIKAKMNLGEDIMLELLRARNTGSDLSRAVIKKSFDDITLTYDAVENKIEFMRIQAVCKGKVSFSNDGLQYEIDYLMPAQNKPTVSVLWSNETASDPESDIQAWMTLIKTNGGPSPAKALTSIEVLNYMLRNVKLRKSMFGTNSDRLATLTDINAYFSAKGYPIIATCDLRARDISGTTYRFFDNDKFVLLPGDGICGKTLVGPTAEALSDSGGIKKVKTIKGITVVQWETPDPVDLWTKAAGTQIVTMPYVDHMVSATVL